MKLATEAVEWNALYPQFDGIAIGSPFMGHLGYKI